MSRNCVYEVFLAEGSSLTPPPTTAPATTLTSSITIGSLTLRTPNLQDTYDMQMRRYVKRAQGGQLLVSGGQSLRKDYGFSFTLITSCVDQLEDIFTYLKDNIGKVVVYTDYESRSWNIIITNVSDPVAHRRNNRYSVQFNATGRPV